MSTSFPAITTIFTCATPKNGEDFVHLAEAGNDWTEKPVGGGRRYPFGSRTGCGRMRKSTRSTRHRPAPWSVRVIHPPRPSSTFSNSPCAVILKSPVSTHWRYGIPITCANLRTAATSTVYTNKKRRSLTTPPFPTPPKRVSPVNNCVSPVCHRKPASLSAPVAAAQHSRRC